MNVRSGRPLSSTFVAKVSRPGSYGDGYGSRGLTLRVKRTANGRTSKTWTQRLRIGGKPTNLGLGRWPEVGLAAARAKAIANSCAVTEGIDPRAAGAPTVADAVEQVIAQRQATWKDGGRTAEIWRSSLQRHAPTVMAMHVDQVTSADVLAVVGPVWRELPATGRKLRRRLSITMRWAVAAGYRSDDPAAEAVLAALPRSNGDRRHIPAEHHSKLADALAAINASRAHPSTKRALRLLALTATRSAEVRGMTWSELDLQARTWTLPAERTKSNREHIVPLSDAALRVIEQARADADGGPLVLPSSTGRELTSAALSKLCGELGLTMRPHGLRSTFRDWCAETGVSREVAEACLAHTVGGVEAAYRRSDLLTQRTAVMADWGRYIHRSSCVPSTPV